MTFWQVLVKTPPNHTPNRCFIKTQLLRPRFGRSFIHIRGENHCWSLTIREIHWNEHRETISVNLGSARRREGAGAGERERRRSRRSLLKPFNSLSVVPHYPRLIYRGARTEGEGAIVCKARAFYRLKTCDLCDRVPGAALNSGRARAIAPLLS